MGPRLEAALFQGWRGARREAGGCRRDAVPRSDDWWRGASGGIVLRSADQRRAGGVGPFDDRGELRSCASRTIWDWFIALSWCWLIRFARLPLLMVMDRTSASSARSWPRNAISTPRSWRPSSTATV